MSLAVESAISIQRRAKVRLGRLVLAERLVSRPDGVVQLGANLRLVFKVRINAPARLLKHVNDSDLAALSEA